VPCLDRFDNVGQLREVELKTQGDEDRGERHGAWYEQVTCRVDPARQRMGIVRFMGMKNVRCTGFTLRFSKTAFRFRIAGIRRP
jgi:hypothetical protein